MAQERMVFAHLLRGIGAISVLLSHYVGIFWIMHPDISSLMGAPVIAGFPNLEFPLSFFANYCIVFGQFGVGVFFVLSGFVISFSIENVRPRDFLIRRAIRIYPVYIVGFSVMVATLYGLSFYTASPFKYSIGDIVAHFGVITRGPLNVGRIDGISWTLEVEIYFYIVMSIFGSVILRSRLKRYLALSLVVAFASGYAMKAVGYLVGVQIASGLLLLIGVVFYSMIRNILSKKDFFVIQGLIVVLICFLWLVISKHENYTMQWMWGYLIAIVVFNGCFALRNKIRFNAFLSHFSDISYPLYVVHALFGYAIMYVLIDNGFGILLTLAVASISAYIAALIIHILVEKPTMGWAKIGWRRASIVVGS